MEAEEQQVQRQLPRGLHSTQDLTRLPLHTGDIAHLSQVAQTFKMRAPAFYLDLVDWDDPQDPVRLQVLPQAAELDWDARELQDPIGDAAHSPLPRLTHRYPDRVLLYPTYQCAVYCRHCFRKEALNNGYEGFSSEMLAPAIEYIATHEQIREVILTGGDPWMLPDRWLRWLRERLEAVPHLRLLRLHTRIPVVLPQRINTAAVEALKGRLMVCIVTHFNHPREVTAEAARACRLLREGGFMLLNQTVLLRGINDDVSVLQTLFQDLVYTLGAKPYYLHHCDLARGLKHLRTSIDDGLEIMRKLRGHISGLCIPHYVLDLPGGDGKIPLGPSYVEAREAHRWLFRTYLGGTHAYEEVCQDAGPDDAPSRPQKER